MDVKEAVRCFLSFTPYHDDELIVFAKSYGDFAKISKICMRSSIIDRGDKIVIYPFAEFSIKQYTYPEVREETVLELLPDNNGDLSIVIDVYQEILDQLSQQGYIPASRVYLEGKELTLEIGGVLYKRTNYRKVFYRSKNFEMYGVFDKIVLVNNCPKCHDIIALFRKTKALFNELKNLYMRAPHHVYASYADSFEIIRGRIYTYRTQIRGRWIYVGHSSLDELYSDLAKLKNDIETLIDRIKRDIVKEKLGLSGLLDS
jgi:hypothetical protein